jgi:hypothetical protein
MLDSYLRVSIVLESELVSTTDSMDMFVNKVEVVLNRRLHNVVDSPMCSHPGSDSHCYPSLSSEVDFSGSPRRLLTARFVT